MHVCVRYFVYLLAFVPYHTPLSPVSPRRLGGPVGVGRVSPPEDAESQRVRAEPLGKEQGRVVVVVVVVVEGAGDRVGVDRSARGELGLRRIFHPQLLL